MMTPRLLGRLFGQDDLKLTVDLVAALDQDVGDGAYALPLLERESNSAMLTLFDQPLQADGTFSAKLALLGEGAELDPFGTGHACTLRDGYNVAALEVDTAFGVTAQGSPSTGGLTLSATAAASGSLTYRHWLPVRDTARLNALGRAVTGSRLPQLVGLAQGDPGYPDIGEVHRLEGKLSLDFGLDFELGRAVQQELTVDLFDGLAPALKVAGEATVKASLGLSLLDRMYLTVGRACQLEERWIRLRLQREHENRLSFGASVALKLHYDLGSGLVAILEETLEQVTLPPLVSSLREVTALLEAGGWDAVKAQLGDEAAEWVSELVADTAWRQWLADDARVQQLTQVSRRLVDAYDGIEPRLQSWWDRLLGSDELDRVRSLLDTVAALDPDDPIDGLLDDFIGGDAQGLVELIEVLTGSTLEDMLLSSDQGVRDTLRQAVELAEKARGYLAGLMGEPGDGGQPQPEVLSTVRDFLQRTGITATVNFLRQNTLSTDLIEQQVSNRIRNLVERLVGKAWDRVTAADLQRVQAWARRLHDILQAPDELEAKLKASLEKLKLDYGLSLSLEVERVSRTTALLDLELDFAQEHTRLQKALADSLVKGDARSMLKDLTRAMQDRKEERDGAEVQPDRDLPFRLRECVFTSERLRTSSFSAFLSVLGLGHSFISSLSGISRRLEQTTLRVRQLEDDSFLRTADYAAAFERTEAANKNTTRAAVWIDCREQGTGLDLEAPYDLGGGQPPDSPPVPQRTLRLTYARNDDASNAAELAALDRILCDLGFADPHPAGTVPPPADLETPPNRLIRQPASVLVPAGSSTRFSCEVRLPEAAVPVVAGALQSVTETRAWNHAYLDAAHRWLDEGSVQRSTTIKPTGLTVGPVAAMLLLRPTFLQHWTEGSFNLRDALDDRAGFTVGGVGIPVTELTDAGVPVWKGEFRLLEAPVKRRGPGMNGLRDVHRKWRDVTRHRTPAAYRALLPTFANGWRRAWARTTLWPNPLFGVWLAVARLTLQDPNLLTRATGAAFLHWKAEEQDDWNAPLVWRLRTGAGIPNNLARGTFPLG